MPQSETNLVNVYFESIKPELAEFISSSSPLPEFLMICINLATEIAEDPSKTNLVITGDFVESTKTRLGDTEAAKSYDLLRGIGVVGGKTIQDGDTMTVLLHADIFELALDYQTNPDPAVVFLRTIAHEMNHVSMYQRGESGAPPLDGSWKATNLISSAAAIIDEYRAELGSLRLIDPQEADWNPSESVIWLEDSLIRVVTEYQEHLDVGKLVFDVGSQTLIALKQLAYCAAYERYSGKKRPLDLSRLRYANTQANFPQWWNDFRGALDSLPSGENSLSQDAEQKARLHVSNLLDTHLRITGFDWDEPMFTIRHDFLHLL
ncbi:hypothetical protein JOD55_000944 [Arcanobacterium pluranimalium]|uniref:hypothetical protein n=1 Tax=Arcanobacterium pluranimalium TaxID=108028 RepID=UPI00195B067D|nr:hypothetical protein [Arcanobacterium pluranimalium]MBM7825117.1 hypothetical protein [Arcanobacterium pluranimalium]